jgi:amino acid permease
MLNQTTRRNNNQPIDNTPNTPSTMLSQQQQQQQSSSPRSSNNNISTNNKKSTILTSILNIFNNQVGSALLTMPWAFKQCGGIIPGLGALTSIAFISWIGFVMIGILCEHFHVTTFTELGGKVGMSGKSINMLMFLYTLGSCISYVILTCDFIAGEGGLAFDCDSTFCILLQYRAAVIFVLFIGVLLPSVSSLSRGGFANLTFISSLSAFGLVFVLAFALVQFVTGIEHERHVHTANLVSVIPGVFLALPVFTVAFCAHYNAPKFFSELEDDNRNATSFATISGIATIFSWFTYGFLGIVAYLTFTHKENIMPDILESYPQNASVVRFAMLIVILSTFPLAFSAMQDSLLALLQREKHFTRMETIVLICITSFPASFMKDIAFILDYKGAVLGSIVSIYVPAIAFSYSSSMLSQSTSLTSNTNGIFSIVSSKSTARVMILIAFILCVSGFVATTLRLMGRMT